jgi:hypothetical protein
MGDPFPTILFPAMKRQEFQMMPWNLHLWEGHVKYRSRPIHFAPCAASFYFFNRCSKMPSPKKEPSVYRLNGC